MKKPLIYLQRTIIFILLTTFLFACKKEKVSVMLPPEDLYGQLFVDVQMNQIFSDGKTFVDCIPKRNPDEIKSDYAKMRDPSKKKLLAFVTQNFTVPSQEHTYQTDSAKIDDHIQKLWQVLKRPADPIQSGTLIPLPNPYIVPGGRFREIYYWDSYFTMLGLQADGEIATMQDMINNFSFLIEKYGHIPNGNRTYYLSRSQPPFYSLMIRLLASEKGDSIITAYLPYLEKEYNFWMDGEQQLDSLKYAYRHVVRMPEGEILNRYWDDKNTPRSESFREDVLTGLEAEQKIAGCKKEDVFRNLRAAAESGWDFSSRWLRADEKGIFNLYTIQTTDIVPVDLNCLMYFMEQTISYAYKLKNDKAKSVAFLQKSESRKKAIQKYFWNDQAGFYMDFNLKEKQHTHIFSLAAAFPMFLNIATKEQAEKIVLKLESDFLKSGGLITTTNFTGQQWDAPNGWAPLQLMTINGLQNYGFSDLAEKITDRWTFLNLRVYKHTFKMLEKYNVVDISIEADGGEYPTQDGFGWTNGVYRNLSKVKIKDKKL